MERLGTDQAELNWEGRVESPVDLEGVAGRLTGCGGWWVYLDDRMLMQQGVDEKVKAEIDVYDGD